jgi:hypothetical protein
MMGMRTPETCSVVNKRQVINWRDFCVWLVNSSGVGRGRAGNRPDYDQQHCYHHAPKVKPEAATAVVELLMMGMRTPETC